MLASEFIVKLNNMIAEHGDLCVVNYDDEEVAFDFDFDGNVFVVGRRQRPRGRLTLFGRKRLRWCDLCRTFFKMTDRQWAAHQTRCD